MKLQFFYDNNRFKKVAKLEELFEKSDNEDAIQNLKREKVEIFIPETCFDTEYVNNDNNNLNRIRNDINKPQHEIIQNTIDIDMIDFNKKNVNNKLKNVHSTPKAIKKLLNEHGLADLTNSPTILLANNTANNKDNLNDENNKENEKKDHYDNIFEKLNQSTEKMKQQLTTANVNLENNDDSLNYTYEFQQFVKYGGNNKNKLKKLKSNDKLNTSNSSLNGNQVKINRQRQSNCENYDENSISSPISSSKKQTSNGKRFKQITMTQAFENLKSQSKESISSISRASGKNKLNKIDMNEDDNENTNDCDDDDDDLVFLEAMKFETNKKNANLNQRKSIRSISDERNNNFNKYTDDNYDDDDDLIFNFDKLPKTKSNSPIYKQIQSDKTNKTEIKSNQFLCKDCEMVIIERFF